MPVRRLMPKPQRPSLRKSGGWVEFRYSSKYVRRTTTDTRFPHDNKRVFRYLLDKLYGANNGKALASSASSCRYYWQERSRGADQSYYTVRLRGNYITVTRQRFLMNGKTVNLFSSAIFGVPEEAELVTDTAVLLRHPCRDHEGFIEAYKRVSSDLGWYDT